MHRKTTIAGHALVMRHSHLLDSGQWDDQVAAFARAYQVIRYWASDRHRRV